MAGPRPGQLSQSGAIPGDAIIATVTNPTWGEGGAPLTPWTENVDAAGYNLINAATITAADGTMPTEAGATLTLRGGLATMGAGGGVAIIARDGSGPGSAGGSVTITAGVGDGGGTAGTVTISTAGTERTRINGIGTTFLGDGTALTAGFGSAGAASTAMHIHRTAASAVMLVDSYNASATSSAYLILRRSRGTAAVPVVVNSGDVIGGVSFQGATTTTDTRTFVDIVVEADSAVGGVNDSPGRLRILTTPDGSGTPVERMRIDSSGTIFIGDGTAGSWAAGPIPVYTTLSYRNSQNIISPYSFSSTATDQSRLIFVRGRGTAQTPAATANADSIGEISFTAFVNSSSGGTGAAISAVVEGTVGAGPLLPTRLAFSTAPSSGAPVERMRITSLGTLLMGDGSIGPGYGGTGGSNFPIIAYRDTTVCTSYLMNFTTDAGGGAFWQFTRGRGTANIPVAVNSSDVLGGIQFAGVDSTTAANLVAEIAGVAASANATTGYLRFSTRSVSTPAERMRITSPGTIFLGDGTLSAPAGGAGSAAFSLGSYRANSDNYISFESYTATATESPNLLFRRSRGLPSAATVISSGDRIGIIRFQGGTQNDTVNSAIEITAEADGAFSGSSAPGRIIIATTLTGALTPVERVRITNAGTLFLGDGTISAAWDAGGAPEPLSAYRNGALTAYFQSFSNTATDQAAHGFYRGRGTAAAPAIVAANDSAGAVAFAAVTGATTGGALAAMNCFVDGTPSTTSTPGRLTFSTTAAGAIVGTERMRIVNLGTVRVGASNLDVQGLSTSATEQVHVQASDNVIVRHVAAGAGVSNLFNFMTGRGTLTASTALSDGDLIGSIGFQAKGDNSTAWNSNATINVYADGAQTVSSGPGRVVFSTAPSGSLSNIERMRITNVGTCMNGDGTLFASWAQGFTATSVIAYRTNLSNGHNIVAFSDTSTEESILSLARGRGTAAAPTAVLSGYVLGRMQGVGFYSVLDTVGAAITFVAEENWGPTSANHGAGIRFSTAINGSATAAVEVMRITNAGNVGIGMAPGDNGETPARIEVTRAAGNYHMKLMATGDASASGGILQVLKARGSFASPAIVQNNDSLGDIRFHGSTGTVGASSEYAKFMAQVDGAPTGTTSAPGRLIFFTTPSGAVTGAEALRIDSVQNIRIPSGSVFGFSSSATNAAAIDSGFSRVSAAVFALGNGTATNATGTLQVAAITAPSGGLTITSTNALLTLSATGAQSIAFSTNGSNRWSVNSSGHLQPENNNAVDLGISTVRPRTIYVGTSVIIETTNTLTTTDGAITQSAGGLTITSTGATLALVASSTNNITFTARSGSAIPFSAAAPDNALVGFTATSVIGALNEVRAAPGLSAHTSNYSLNTTTDLAPKVHTNDGATGTVNMPLPSAAVGLAYMIYVGAAFIFGFTAAAGDTIQFDNAAVSISGGYIRCDGTAVGIGAWLEIRALDSTRWAVTSYTGSWTVEV